jgi:triosephosphate isomerase (TIM)
MVMSAMRKLIVGNWKMNGSLDLAQRMTAELRSVLPDAPCDLVVCPPATLLFEVSRALAGSQIGVGGQDCHEASKGAYTGDVSADMLREAGASWVILGHSERRSAYGETDALIRRKAAAATAAGLTPIICVGETAQERDAGRQSDVIGAQIKASIPDGFDGVIAYEPIWAIGTGRSARAQDIAEMHAFIRAQLERIGVDHRDRNTPVLYGGSVNADNANEILATQNVAGALVGSASLIPWDFIAIARAASCRVS